MPTINWCDGAGSYSWEFNDAPHGKAIWESAGWSLTNQGAALKHLNAEVSQDLNASDQEQPAGQ